MEEALPLNSGVKATTTFFSTLRSPLHYRVRTKQLLTVDEDLPWHLRSQWAYVCMLVRHRQHFEEVFPFNEEV